MDTLKPPGEPPGTMHVDPEAAPSILTIFGYGPQGMCEETQVSVERIAEIMAQWPVAWVDVTGLGNAETLRKIGELFGLHPLVLEDVLHVTQRPKVEEYEDYNFIVVRMLDVDARPETEQLAMVQKESCVITFQEDPGDCLDPVRDRIRRNMGRIRRQGADYLAYSLIDSVMDFYMPLLDWYDERIENLERQIIAGPKPTFVAAIYELKHEILNLRRILLSLRDAIGLLYHEEVPLFAKETIPYLRDCYDHTLRIIDNLELFRERVSGLMDLYISSMSQRMNEIMKVLTIISTIFIPLSFIAGVYGMNFDTRVSAWNMPELEWRWGYPFALAIMAAVAVTMLVYFRRKGWLGGNGEPVTPPPREDE